MELREAIKMCIENGFDTAFNFLDLVLYRDHADFVVEFNDELFLPDSYTGQFTHDSDGFLLKRFQNIDEAIECFVIGSDYLRDVELNYENLYQDR